MFVSDQLSWWHYDLINQDWTGVFCRLMTFMQTHLCWDLQSKKCSFVDGRRWSIHLRHLGCSAVQKSYASARIPTWQYILQCAKAYLALFMFCEMVHPALWHAWAGLLSVQGLELTAEHLELESAPVCNKASLRMAESIWLGIVAHALWVTADHLLGALLVIL